MPLRITERGKVARVDAREGGDRRGGKAVRAKPSVTASARALLINDCRRRVARPSLRQSITVPLVRLAHVPAVRASASAASERIFPGRGGRTFTSPGKLGFRSKSKKPKHHARSSTLSVTPSATYSLSSSSVIIHRRQLRLPLGRSVRRAQRRPLHSQLGRSVVLSWDHFELRCGTFPSPKQTGKASGRREDQRARAAGEEKRERGESVEL